MWLFVLAWQKLMQPLWLSILLHRLAALFRVLKVTSLPLYCPSIDWIFAPIIGDIFHRLHSFNTWTATNISHSANSKAYQLAKLATSNHIFESILVIAIFFLLFILVVEILFFPFSIFE